jgi:hypothetical protein
MFLTKQEYFVKMFYSSFENLILSFFIIFSFGFSFIFYSTMFGSQEKGG